ncbi:MAG: formate dehydrogenase accessory sulfurtransferase FdhD [Gammaproteobacteria bacterium]|nr:formate dehydrogenase accessory sulfurtransferase FdhD [Gammaproteobacteria bacterium]MYL00505.1 formate dehydrogenase accessory sulfurtransferase FdhD [Gammaproteobacteria bacterium]
MRASAALKSVKSVRIERFGADGGTRDDVVAMEEPLEIRLSWTHPDGRREQKSISITMRTPGNDEELAAGFLLTEGIIAGPAELEAVGPCGPPAANGLINVVRVDLARDVEVDLARLERHFYTSSSCGVCGKASLEAVAVQGHYDLHDNTLRMSAEGLGALPDRLRALQSVFERTGGLHASGLFDAAGQVRISREDVGRHNALDKLIGQALLKDELPLSDCGVVVSGRASFELMQKAMTAGIPMVAAVGAPSSLAVEFAEEFGMTLVGFLTANRFNVYSRPDRIA